MFRRILSAARHRDLDFSNLLKYELTPVPSSLFFEDGSMRKSPKAELGKKNKSFCQPLFEIKDRFNSCIIDAMGLLQEIPKKSVKTYSDIGSIIFKKLLDLFNKTARLLFLSSIVTTFKILQKIMKGNEEVKVQPKLII
jgi:hypothetical protein